VPNAIWTVHGPRCATSPFAKYGPFVTSYIIYKILLTRCCFIGFWWCWIDLWHFRLILHFLFMLHRKWSFNGDLRTKPTSFLQYFLTHLLFGEVEKTVNVACQFLVQNTKVTVRWNTSLRTVGSGKLSRRPLQSFTPCYPCKSAWQEPSSLATSLKSTLEVITRGSLILRSVATRRSSTCASDSLATYGATEMCFDWLFDCRRPVAFVYQTLWRKLSTFGLLDLLEDTPTGQKTFHGTVINQRAEDVTCHFRQASVVCVISIRRHQPAKTSYQIQATPIWCLWAGQTSGFGFSRLHLCVGTCQLLYC